MRKLCCACHSSSIAALIYIIVVPDMHGQKVVQVQEPLSLSDRNAEQPSQQQNSKFEADGDGVGTIAGAQFGKQRADVEFSGCQRDM